MPLKQILKASQGQKKKEEEVIYKIKSFHRFIYPGENHEKPGIGSVCQFQAEDLLREV